ncbi:hypothetical protein Acr_00g0017140 [Actinidia rufa]|uniref:Uncharacterized protein n=1 Tax=Actinidia rufa TaxID=165716 RepID=A0A7J0DB29_9ERIC|nr:hypothetical protein Acr_00g0017140 [Actinidia rufa]
MHLRSRRLPRSSASIPLGNRAHPMVNTSQVPDLEGLHREIHGMAEQMRIMNENNARLMQHLTTNNPPPPASPAPSHRSHRSGNNESQNHHSTSRNRRHRPPIPRRRERSSSSESRSSSETLEIEGEEVRRIGRSTRRNDQVPRHLEESTTQKIRDLNAKIDAINIGASAPVTIDALIRQTVPPVHEKNNENPSLLQVRIAYPD